MSSWNKPEILFVAGSGEFGSGEWQIIDYLSSPDEKPFAPELIFPEAGRLVEKAREAGLQVRIIKGHNYLTELKELWRQPIAWVYNLSSFVKTSAVIRKKRIQMVISLSFINWTGALAARQEGVSHIWMIREVLSGRTNWLNFFWGRWLASRLANDLSVRVLLESSLAAEMFRRKRTQEKSLVLPPAIDADRFEQQLGNLDSGRPGSGLALFFSGFDIRRVREVLDVVNEVASEKRKGSDFFTRVLMFFPGLNQKQHDKLKERIHRESAGLSFKLESFPLDWLPSEWRNFRAAVVFPGFDPLSRIVLEAGLARVPVMVEKGASSELVVPERTGFVFDYRDYSSLEAFLRLIVSNQDTGRQMGAAAREHILRNFNLLPWKQRFESIVTEALSSSHG